ncbi:DUF6300 family protein [Streptomyces sp. NPDC060064]|uniref:DUF6300 family protein n=1 Tax=Streptomyces sp. NPDC060064 TaxID=3347049 RepID=UPI00369479BC
MSDTEEILFQLDELPPCPCCGGAVLLLARFSHVWKNSRGEGVAGARESLLCPACDRAESTADQLLALSPCTSS